MCVETLFGGSAVKDPPANAGDTGLIPGQEDPLQEEMVTHSSILAWRIPWTGARRVTVHGAAESRTRLSMHTHLPYISYVRLRA